MKRMTPVICALILGLSVSFAAVAEAGLRIVPDLDLTGESGRTVRISALMNRVVKNPQGQDLGLIRDVVIDRNGRIAFVVIGEADDEQLIPIPFKSVLLGGLENWLILSNVDKAKFEHAPSIRRDQWEKLEDPAFENEVFSYYGRTFKR